MCWESRAWKRNCTHIPNSAAPRIPGHIHSLQTAQFSGEHSALCDSHANTGLLVLLWGAVVFPLLKPDPFSTEQYRTHDYIFKHVMDFI